MSNEVDWEVLTKVATGLVLAAVTALVASVWSLQNTVVANQVRIDHLNQFHNQMTSDLREHRLEDHPSAAWRQRVVDLELCVRALERGQQCR